MPHSSSSQLQQSPPSMLATLAFITSLPLSYQPRPPSSLSSRTPRCVSRPEHSPNPLTAAFAIVTTLFRRQPNTPEPEGSSVSTDSLPPVTPSRPIADNDGLHERLAARADDDGLETRLAERRRRASLAAAAAAAAASATTAGEDPSTTSTTTTSRAAKRRRTAPVPFLARRRGVQPPAALSRIPQARIQALVASSLSQNRAPDASALATLLPYDVQRQLFDELRNAPRRAWPAALLHAVAEALRLPGPGQAAAPAAAAYTAAAMAQDQRVALESDYEGQSAAAAYAAAAAIATSASAAQLDDAEREGLRAAVSAARAVANVDDAAVFVETVGVAPLVTAAHLLPGADRAAALTALANIAIVLPKARTDMLTADGALVQSTIADIVYKSGQFRVSQAAGGDALSYTEALVSGTHLLGSLALAKSGVGMDFRTKMALNKELVRRLQRLAGGLKNGEPEGAARAARRALGALGINKWKPRVPGQRGLRILSIDGGGTRAIMAFEMLKELKKATGCEIHELFDIIGGTSTGAIVAASIGLAHKTVEEVELLYRDMIGKVFAKHPVNGPKMLLTKAYYDTSVLETTLKKECGGGVFIDSLADENMNRVFVVSSIMSRDPKELHVFRNYTYPLGHESRYVGTPDSQLWEGLRASSAAPTFFSEIRVNGELHADGAIVANNPTAVALHETKCMFPGVPIELLVSLGNGVSPAHEHSGREEDEKKNVGWGDVVGSIVASATSTETVHYAMQDLFPKDKYFRFNPITDSTQIDETHPETLAMFVKEAQVFIEDNHDEFATVAQILRPKTPRSLFRRFRDAMRKEIQELENSAWHDDLYLP